MLRFGHLYQISDPKALGWQAQVKEAVFRARFGEKSNIPDIASLEGQAMYRLTKDPACLSRGQWDYTRFGNQVYVVTNSPDGADCAQFLQAPQNFQAQLDAARQGQRFTTLV